MSHRRVFALSVFGGIAFIAAATFATIAFGQSTGPGYDPIAGVWGVKVQAPAPEDGITRACIYRQDDLTTEIGCIDNPATDPDCTSVADVPCYTIAVSVPLQADDVLIVGKQCRGTRCSAVSNTATLRMPVLPMILLP